MSHSALEGGDAAPLRAALQSIARRRDEYRAKKAQLEDQWKKELDEHTAGTLRRIQEWGRVDVDDFKVSILDSEILARNAQARQMENTASYQQAANLRNFESDLDAILHGVGVEDGQKSERNSVARHTESMVVDEAPAQKSLSPEVLPTREGSARIAQKRARELDSPYIDTDRESPGRRKSRRVSGGSSKASTIKAEKPRTITFDEVYQGGNAQHKHAIFTCAFGSPGKWYIVKCETDDHTVHFGGIQSALHGAAKHLSGRSHGMMSKSHKNALEQLGWEVLGCDKAKAAANNAALDDALRKGYRPVNTINRVYRKSRVGIGEDFDRGTGSASPSRRPTSSSGTTPSRRPVSSLGTTITRAKGGELYYAWWPSDSMYYLCLIIPWDGMSFGLPELHRGIEGLGLFDKKQARVPKCYTVDNESRPRAITGWSEGYEDGGPNEAKRQFPILFFHPPRNLGAWVPASALEPFDWRDPKFGVPGYHLLPGSVDLALAAFARSKGFPCFRDFRAAQRTVDAPVVPAAIETETAERLEIASPVEDTASPSAFQENEDEVDSPLTDVPTPASGLPDVSAPDVAQKELSSGAPSPAESGTGSVPIVDREPAARDKPAAEGTANGATTNDDTPLATPVEAVRPTQSEAAPERAEVVPPAQGEAASKRVENPLPPKPQMQTAPSPLGATPITPQVKPPGLLKGTGPAIAQTAIRSRSGFPSRSQSRVVGPSAAPSPLRTPAGIRTPLSLPPKPQAGVGLPSTPSHTPADRERSAVNLRGQEGPSAPPVTIANPPAASNTPTRQRSSMALTNILHPSTAVNDTAQVRASPRPTPTAKSPPATHNPVRTQPNPTPTAAADATPSSSANPDQTGTVPVKTRASFHPPLSSIPPASESPSILNSPLVKKESVQQFYLFKYEGTGGSWTAASDSERLVLEIDADSRTARSRPGQPVTFVIDPKRIVGHSSSRNEPEPGKHTLTLTVEGEPTDKQQLVFDKYGGVTASRQARQFWTWANGV